MELIFLMLVIFAIIAFVSEMNSKEAVKNPDSFGRRLQYLARSGKTEKLRELLMRLPDWPIRSLLVNAVENLGELRRGTTLAEPAGVPKQTTQLIMEAVEKYEQEVWSIATRVASLAQQSSAPSLNKLPGEAIQWLNRDMHVLTGISQVAYDTHRSLTVAIAKGRGALDRPSSISVELQALATAVRKLSEPS